MVVFLRWSETAGRVPTRALSVVMLMTPCFTITVEDRVDYNCCIQHRLEVPPMCINIFVVLWLVRSELVDEHP
jgi:hypothetical protein